MIFPMSFAIDANQPGDVMSISGNWMTPMGNCGDKMNVRMNSELTMAFKQQSCFVARVKN